MRAVALAPITDQIFEMQKIYGPFDLGFDGLPTPAWEARNLRTLRLENPLASAFFPDFWYLRVKVNRRMYGPLSQVFREINVRWTSEAQTAHGINQFIKCYCFGGGPGPDLFWYGGAWELSPQVGGEVLADLVKVFTRHGFTHAYAQDKRKPRVFEYW